MSYNALGKPKPAWLWLDHDQRLEVLKEKNGTLKDNVANLTAQAQSDSPNLMRQSLGGPSTFQQSNTIALPYRGFPSSQGHSQGHQPFSSVPNTSSAAPCPQSNTHLAVDPQGDASLPDSAFSALSLENTVGSREDRRASPPANFSVPPKKRNRNRNYGRGDHYSPPGRRYYSPPPRRHIPHHNTRSTSSDRKQYDRDRSPPQEHRRGRDTQSRDRRHTTRANRPPPATRSRSPLSWSRQQYSSRKDREPRTRSKPARKRVNWEDEEETDGFVSKLAKFS